MKNVLIVDYEMGNTDSIYRAIEECGGNPIISRKTEDFNNSSAIILPGVGAFNKAMQNIKKFNLDKILSEQVLQNHKPILGICLGMQILASKGYEGGITNGLGFIDGEVKRFEKDQPETRIPHIGWNNVEYIRDSTLIKNIPNNSDFYFVHSYHFICQNNEDILATTSYCGKFNSIINRKNIFGTQFHPEKSQRVGFQLLKNFINFN
jgi:glutamine amidotransferase